jgi:6-pyruvoyltetrahydropterin/6-carboxytetrahydropterin synthase
METYSVRVAGDDLIFAAAHFITFEDGEIEPLHGHDFRVAAEVEWPLGPAGYALDFAVVKRMVRAALAELDHRVLLPAEHPALRLVESPGEVEATLGARRWVFPRADCALLPLANTTAELLARHLARRLADQLAVETGIRPWRVRLEVEESPGRRAACELAFGGSEA